MKRPNTCTNLIRAINTVATGTDAVRLSRQLANVIVGQMLPDGVIKGGSSLMFRYGSRLTRYTRDVDTARVMEHGEYVDRLQRALAAGWNGFTTMPSTRSTATRVSPMPLRFPSRARHGLTGSPS